MLIFNWKAFKCPTYSSSVLSLVRFPKSFFPYFLYFKRIFFLVPSKNLTENQATNPQDKGDHLMYLKAQILQGPISTEPWKTHLKISDPTYFEYQFIVV